METRSSREGQREIYTGTAVYVMELQKLETSPVPGQMANFRIYLCINQTSCCHRHGMNKTGCASSVMIQEISDHRRMPAIEP
jgi:hypothetical protein